MHCKAFEDNSGAIDLARLPKIRCHTKKINILSHHFHGYLRKGLTHKQNVSTNNQCTDSCTKPSQQNIFLKHQKMIFSF